MIKESWDFVLEQILKRFWRILPRYLESVDQSEDSLSKRLN